MSFGRLGALGRGFGRLGSGGKIRTVVPGIITAGGGSFLFTGSDASLLAQRKIAAASGSFAFTGSDASLLASARIIAANSGAFVFSGDTMTPLQDYKIPAASGSFSFTGADATLTKTSAWTPASLPNLIAWYKADAGVFSDAGTTPATNGQKVRQWNDQSGNGYHLGQSDTNHQPVFQSTSWTGSKNAVFFDPAVGNEATLMTTSGVAMGTGSPFSCFAMCQLESGASANGRVLVYSAGGNEDFQGGGGILLSRDGSNQAIGTYRNGSVATASIIYATDTRMGFIGDGTNTTPYVNNSAGTPSSDTQTFTSGGYVGVGGAIGAGVTRFNSYWKGKIAEIVLTNGALSSGDRNSLDAYFTSRW